MVRVRFSPSPTGPLHLGGIRTALFNYLFAKQQKGQLILRIEDTDLNRFVPNSEKHILDSLEWCGITFDESSKNSGSYGPYKQSERTNLYKKYIHQLIENDMAYYAFDSKEDLDHIRKKHDVRGEKFLYNYQQRALLKNSTNLSIKETKERLKNEDYVIRFKVTPHQTIVINDMIRGEVHFQSHLMDDKILYKSDGMPTYHFANVIDDHLMAISHVIRGEEWLPSAPLHKMLYKAFGWENPTFAHLPLILKPNGKGKLSKRDGDKLGVPVFALNFEDNDTKHIYKGFKEEGYLPESIINFIAFMGWNPGNEKEIYSLKELIKDFNIDNVNTAGSKFDIEKLRWYNHNYIQNTSNEFLSEGYINLLDDPTKISKNKALQIVEHTKERAYTIKDFLTLSDYLVSPPKSYNQKALKKCLNENSKSYLEHFLLFIEQEDAEKSTKQWIIDNNVSMGKFMPLARITLTGDLKGIHLFDIIKILGVEESKSRIKKLLEKLY